MYPMSPFPRSSKIEKKQVVLRSASFSIRPRIWFLIAILAVYHTRGKHKRSFSQHISQLAINVEVDNFLELPFDCEDCQAVISIGNRHHRLYIVIFIEIYLYTSTYSHPHLVSSSAADKLLESYTHNESSNHSTQPHSVDSPWYQPYPFPDREVSRQHLPHLLSAEE